MEVQRQFAALRVFPDWPADPNHAHSKHIAAEDQGQFPSAEKRRSLFIDARLDKASVTLPSVASPDHADFIMITDGPRRCPLSEPVFTCMERVARTGNAITVNMILDPYVLDPYVTCSASTR